MRKLTKNDLNEILRKHVLWLDGEDGEIADLREADLTGSDLIGANLRGADLSAADLTMANLRGADLREANMNEANLRWANLRGADLREAHLRWTDLTGANFRGADLRGANMSEANLRLAILSEANLSEADLTDAYLKRAILRETENIPYIPLACPEEGSFIGFKKAYIDPIGYQPVIVKLLVLEDAKRSSGTGRKCRCSKAKILDIQDLDGNSIGVVAYSKFDNEFVYKIGEIIEVGNFDENRFNECAPGIHFFVNRMDAVNYY